MDAFCYAGNRLSCAVRGLEAVVLSLVKAGCVQQCKFLTYCMVLFCCSDCLLTINVSAIMFVFGNHSTCLAKSTIILLRNMHTTIVKKILLIASFTKIYFPVMSNIPQKHELPVLSIRQNTCMGRRLYVYKVVIEVLTTCLLK